MGTRRTHANRWKEGQGESDERTGRRARRTQLFVLLADRCAPRSAERKLRSVSQVVKASRGATSKASSSCKLTGRCWS